MRVRRLLARIVLGITGPRLLLVLGDTLVLDRWRWIRSQLPHERSTIIDAGCGNGWLAINCARGGHRTLGMGWCDRELDKANARARMFETAAEFQVQDLRELGSRADLVAQFDIVTCSEVIEHIIDDVSLMVNLARLLRPGGYLLLTAPNLFYVPMDAGDAGPFSTVEDGGHVRRGYSPDSIRRIAEEASLKVEAIAYCSGRTSQLVTRYLRILTRRIGYWPAWLMTFWLRILPPLIDRPGQRYPPYSICVRASKPVIQ